jgi:hypothetical protein
MTMAADFAIKSGKNGLSLFLSSHGVSFRVLF